MPSYRRSARLAALLLPLTAPAAAAQLQLRVDGQLGFASAYVDRGVILTNTPVLQPALRVGIPSKGGLVALGLWANVEPATYADPSYFSMADTLKRPNLTEFRPSLSFTQGFGGKREVARFELTAEYRMFPNVAGITSESNTGRITTGVGLTAVPFAPTVLVGYELGGVLGAFVDGRVAQSLRVAPGLVLDLGARGGWSIRQQADPATGAMAAYTRDGFAYADLTAGMSVTVAGVTVRPWLTWTLVESPAAPGTGPRYQRSDYLWVGATVGAGGVFPKAKPAPAKR